MPAAKRKVVVTLDTYLSILAVVSSFCAIGITFYQAYLQRTQQYASVMPVLDSYVNDGEREKGFFYELVIINNGIGPAFIKDYGFSYKEKPYKSFNEIVRAVAVDRLGYKDEASLNKLLMNNIVFSGLWENRVIPANQDIKLVSVTDSELGLWMDEAAGRGDINVKIRYASIYGEEWQFEIVVDKPELRNIKVKD